MDLWEIFVSSNPEKGVQVPLANFTFFVWADIKNVNSVSKSRRKMRFIIKECNKNYPPNISLKKINDLLKAFSPLFI